MSDIRFNQWLHQSGTGGVSQSDGGHVGIGTTNPLIPVGAGNTHILNVGVVTCNNISAGSSITATTFFGSGANLTSLPASTTITVADESSDTTCFPLFATDATGNIAPKSGSNLTFNSSTGDLGVTKVTASNVTSSGTVLIDTTSYSEASGDGDDLIIGSTSDTQKGITIVGSTSGGIGNIFFSDGASYKNQGLIQYRHADDSMRIHVNQNERLRITSTGQLLVGTSSVSNRFKNGNGNGATPKFQFETANVDEQNDISLTFGRNNAFGAEIILAKHRAATVGGYTVVQSGDRLGGINFAGSDGTHFRPAALIQGRVDSTPGTADMPGRLEFLTTADGAATPTERLRIGSSGQIGLSGANYGSSGQVLTSQGSGSAPQWATPSSVTTAGGTMTIGFQDHVNGNTSSTTATGYYQRIGNMVFATVDTGAINKSGLQSGQILLLTGCFPVTRDNNWTISGSCSHYNVNSGQNGGGHVVVPQKGYWLSNTSMYFTIPRNNSTADNLTVGMMSGNNARFFINWSYKVN